MRSMSLIVAGGALCLGLASAAHAQSSDPYADSYRAYHQQYGDYGQDQDEQEYSGGATYGQDYAPYGSSPAYGTYGQRGWGDQSYGAQTYGGSPYSTGGYGSYGGYGQGYGSSSDMDGYNPQSYGPPGYAPPANASPGYHQDPGAPGMYGRPDDDDDDNAPPSSYGARAYANPSMASSSGGYPLPPN